MTVASMVDENMSSRELVRTLRISASRCGDVMPESVAWHAFLELRKRGHDTAGELFIGALRSLHRRRSMAGSDLSVNDQLIEEHRLADDGLLSELWKAYKKCIKNNRTGPAGQLLKEIEDRLLDELQLAPRRPAGHPASAGRVRPGDADLTDDLLAQIDSYPALYLACAFSGLGIPMPEDVPVLYTGLQLAAGHWDPVPALITLLLGITTRDVLAWTLGRTLGDRLLGAAWFQRIVPASRIDAARTMLRERGAVAVLVGRLLVGLRAPTFLVAGASGIPLRTFLAYDLLGMVVVVPTVCTLGYVAGPRVLEVGRAVASGSTWVWIAVIAIAVALWWRRSRSGDQA